MQVGRCDFYEPNTNQHNFVCQELMKDDEGNLLIQSDGFIKPFQLWSNTAITDIEMTAPEIMNQPNDHDAEKPAKQVLLKVNDIRVEDCTIEIVEKLRKMNALY